MAEQNVEARVDELSKPGNEAELAKVIGSQFNQAVGTVVSEPTKVETPEPKPVTVDDPKPADPKPATTEDPKPAAGEDDNKNDKFKEILSDRNKAEGAAADAQTEVQILTKQVSDLNLLVQKLTSGKQGAGEGDEPNGDDPSADDKPMTKKEIDEYLASKEQEKSKTSEQLAAAEKSITDAIQALEGNADFPNATQFAEQIKEVMKTFPTMKASVAYDLLKGRGVIPAEEVNNSNANRTGTGNRSKSNLIKSKQPSEMSTAELEQEVRALEKGGSLVGLV